MGLGVLLLGLAAGCGDDEGAESGAGSSGDPTGPSSTGLGMDTGGGGASDSGGDPGSTGDPSSTGPGTTSAVDDTSTGSEDTASGEETAIPAVGFDEVLSIIAAECSCHRSPMFVGQLDLRDDAAYASLVSVPSAQAPRVDRVSPGDPDGSYLYLKLLNQQGTVGGGGSRMPQGGMLLPEELDLVRYWILGGANP